jgi:hypothetical protein
MNNPFFLQRQDGNVHGGAKITAATHLPRVMSIDESVLLAAHLVNLAEIGVPAFVELFQKLFHHDKPAAPAVPATPTAAEQKAAADKAAADKAAADKAAAEAAKPAAAPVPAAPAPAAPKK